jgi:hypothetical protein
MNESSSICKPLHAYRKAVDDPRATAYSNCQGSLEKTLKCGCVHCSLACQMVYKGDEMARYRERVIARDSNMDISTENSVPIISEDMKIDAIFKNSGLRFEGKSIQKELFVTDSKISQIPTKNFRKID